MVAVGFSTGKRVPEVDAGIKLFGWVNDFIIQTVRKMF